MEEDSPTEVTAELKALGHMHRPFSMSNSSHVGASRGDV